LKRRKNKVIIFCQWKDRNKDKPKKGFGIKSKSEKALIKDIDCPVFYLF